MTPSEQINAEYAELSTQKDTTRKLEKLRSKCLKGLKKTLKSGNNITGKLEHELIKNSSALKKAKSKWARTRGNNFETDLTKTFNAYFEKYSHGVAYHNKITKFSFQPYDIVLFLKDLRPVFLECKAAGVKLKKDEWYLSACSRRYNNYLAQREKVDNFLAATNSPLFFSYNCEEHKKVVFVHHSFVKINAEILKTKSVKIPPEVKIVLDQDSAFWEEKLLQSFHKN